MACGMPAPDDGRRIERARERGGRRFAVLLPARYFRASLNRIERNRPERLDLTRPDPPSERACLMSTSPPTLGALDRARAKAYVRLLPLLFLSYAIAYVDRVNVSLATLRMTKDLPGFDNAVIGFGAGIFFIGYFLLEIPGTLLVEKWSARKWICRIMVSWGIVAALTAFVTTPLQFYAVRFLLGLAEAGFFPGVIVYLTHWFPVARPRAGARPGSSSPRRSRSSSARSSRTSCSGSARRRRSAA